MWARAIFEAHIFTATKMNPHLENINIVENDNSGDDLHVSSSVNSNQC